MGLGMGSGGVVRRLGIIENGVGWSRREKGHVEGIGKRDPKEWVGFDWICRLIGHAHRTD